MSTDDSLEAGHPIRETERPAAMTRDERDYRTIGHPGSSGLHRRLRPSGLRVAGDGAG